MRPRLSALELLGLPLAILVLGASLLSRAWHSLVHGLVAGSFVEALHEGTPRSRMTWATRSEHADAVVDQVARQLELGYERIQPHNARLLGFG